MTQELILRDGGINWTWYMWAVLNDDASVTVKRYDRLHDFDLERNGEPHPQANGTLLRKTEDESKGARTLVGIRWQRQGETEPRESIVANPGYVFDYKGS